MSDEPLIAKLTSKSQVVVPQAVRRKLNLKPGDRIRYRLQDQKVIIEKLALASVQDDPFIAFDEWGSKADEDAYADL